MRKQDFRKLSHLRDLRERFGVTQAELAKELGVTPQYISALERGLNELTYYDAYIISRYLGLTPDSVFLKNAQEREKQEKIYIKEKDEENLERRRLEFEEQFNRNINI